MCSLSWHAYISHSVCKCGLYVCRWCDDVSCLKAVFFFFYVRVCMCFISLCVFIPLHFIQLREWNSSTFNSNCCHWATIYVFFLLLNIKKEIFVIKSTNISASSLIIYYKLIDVNKNSGCVNKLIGDIKWIVKKKMYKWRKNNCFIYFFFLSFFFYSFKRFVS